MKKIAIFLLGVLFFALFYILFSPKGLIFGAQKSAQADTSGSGITKDTIVFENSYGDVTFTHKKHNVDYKIDCYDADCHHHTLRNKETKQDLCRDCHKKNAEGNTPSKKDAFHKSCKTCHEDRKKENKPTGPTACKECHKKK
jgi:hypothetical protein